MKKRFVSVLLGLALALSLCVPAFASSGMDNFRTSRAYADGTFSDVASDAWYRNPVKQCYEYGLMGGKDTGIFDPDGGLTIAEAIVMADQVHSIYSTGSVTKPTGDPWYEGYVKYAEKKGIIKNSDFADYDVRATRAQMAYIFANALPNSEYAVLAAVKSVPDVGTSDKYASDIYKLYDAGILSGSDIYGNFNPDSSIKRCEAAVILRNVALAAQRGPTVLFKGFTCGDVGFAMPADATATTSDGVDEYVYSTVAEKACNTAVQRQQVNAGGEDITAIPIGDLKNQLISNLAASGVTATVNSSRTVYFGSVPAYRYALTTTAGSVTRNQYAYEVVIGNVWYEVAFTSNNPTMIDTIDSTITIGGYSAG